MLKDEHLLIDILCIGWLFSVLRHYFSAIKLPADPDTPAYQIEVVLDPVSQEAQKIAPMIKVWSTVKLDVLEPF